MKATVKQRCKLAVAAALLTGGLFHYAPVNAALLDIAKVPLFVGGVGVVPNVFITIDDSGSMDWEFTTNHYWVAYAYDWDVRKTQYNTSNDRVAGTQKRWWGFGNTYASYDSSFGPNGDLFSYYFPNGDNAYKNGDECSSSNVNSRAIYACNTNYTLYRPNRYRSAPNTDGILWDWRMFSSDLNVLYYNPQTTYEPWVGVDVDSSYTNARSNPQPGTNGYNDTRNLSAQDFYYAVWNDDKGWDSSHSTPRGGNVINMTTTPNSKMDLWDTYTLYTVEAGGSHKITIKTFQTTYCPTSSPYPSLSQEPRCYRYNNSGYIKGRLLVDQVGSTITLTGNGAKSQLGGLSIPEVKTNIANWYSYNRRRSLVAKGAIADVINQFPNFRYGVTVLNNYGGNGNPPGKLFVEMPAAASPPFDTHNADLTQKMYDFKFTSNGTPLRQALKRAGQYYEGTLSGKTTPILPIGAGGECQQNFTLLTSDGFWNGGSPSLGNKDSDGYSNTLADVAHYYYNKDLSTSLPNKVPVTPFDYAYWQHMVLFSVAFGVEGNFQYPTGNGWPTEINPLSESADWGNPAESGSSPAKIDDMWHAAYNARGSFYSARNPSELVEGLSRALSNILARTGSASAISLNTGFVTNSTGATSYLARFNSEDWTGQLVAVGINSDGTFNTDTPIWDTSAAGSQFAGQSPASRNIFTSKPDGTGIEFLWNQLDSSQQDLLNIHPVTQSADGKGSERLEFLRGKGVDGDAAWLGSNDFRSRNSMLGDIIHSDPFYVDGSPPMVYVSSNDGMLHAFNASTGKEIFAYIPNAIFDKLNYIPSLDYAHFYTVDGSPVVKDIGGRKILVGSMRGGGQAIYALDVTNPSSFSTSDVLWEFSDDNDADLGYTFSKPTIAKMADGNWVAIIGNGYNNTVPDGHASSTGNAVLYILDAETGIVKSKIDTGKGQAASPTGTPNGLSTPAVILDPVDTSKSKYIYAGDLLGDLWKFDVSNSSSTAWDIAYAGKPLFEAVSPDGDIQPITIRPEVDIHPYRGFVVFFGTGKYFESTDNSSSGQVTQSLYAIWDRDWGSKLTDPSPLSLLPQEREQLLQQEILASVSLGADFDNRSAYVTSDHAISWHEGLDSNPDPNATDPTHVGWYVDLIYNGSNGGERQVTNGLLRDGIVIFNTTIPSADLCDAGGTSNQIILDSISGSRLKTSPFDGVGNVDVDLDGDGITESVTVSSMSSTVGILSEPKVVQNLESGKEYIVSLGSTGQPDSAEVDPTQDTLGRQSWRQLPQQ